MRLIVARCSVSYTGRLSTELPEAVRLLMVKPDGTFMVWADGGGPSVRPLNWMAAPTIVDEHRNEAGSLERINVRTRSASAISRVRTARRGDEDMLEITISEVISDAEHELDAEFALEKEGIERELQELLAQAPQWCGEGLRLVRREWPTDIGPVDLMCRDEDDGWIAVEIKRVGTIDAVEQLARYLERIREDPALGECRGILAAETIKPQARVLAGSRGIDCVEVDPRVLRGERQPDLQLFAA
jgi:RecB family endonuclease NucS